MSRSSTGDGPELLWEIADIAQLVEDAEATPKPRGALQEAGGLDGNALMLFRFVMNKYGFVFLISSTKPPTPVVFPTTNWGPIDYVIVYCLMIFSAAALGNFLRHTTPSSRPILPDRPTKLTQHRQFSGSRCQYPAQASTVATPAPHQQPSKPAPTCRLGGYLAPRHLSRIAVEVWASDKDGACRSRRDGGG